MSEVCRYEPKTKIGNANCGLDKSSYHAQPNSINTLFSISSIEIILIHSGTLC